MWIYIHENVIFLLFFLIPVLVHCDKRGSEMIAGDESHIFRFETGVYAQIGGVSVFTTPNFKDGTFSIDAVRKNIRGHNHFEPLTQLVMVEQTHNNCGGSVVPLDWIEELSKVCKEKNVKIHMDGSRIFNAAEHLGVPVARVARDVDSISFCLSKALCCPVGSMLSGTKEFVEKARKVRKALGGGLRQSGFLAAPGIYALDNIVPLLKNDHRHTRELAVAIDNVKSSIFTVDLPGLHSNILMINVLENPKRLMAKDLQARLLEVKDNEVAQGVHDKDRKPIVVKASLKDENTARVIFYQQIDDEQCELAIKKIVYVLKELEQK